MIKEKPILFSAPMVLAVLDDSKTHTRRIVKTKETGYLQFIGFTDNDKSKLAVFTKRNSPGIPITVKCPYGKVGDELWVRESVYADHDTSDCVTLAKYHDGVPVIHDYNPALDQDGEYKDSIAHWWYSRDCCPSIHIPRWASRIQLRITDIRVEWLNDISNKDAFAEGVTQRGKLFSMDWSPVGKPIKGVKNADGSPAIYTESFIGYDNPVGAFAALWEKINGPKSWKKDAWVWVVEFERIKP